MSLFDRILLAFSSLCFMLYATAAAIPTPTHTDKTGSPSFDNLYGWSGTPAGYAFLALSWAASLSVFIHAIGHTTWAFGTAALTAWITRSLMELPAERPDWWWRVTLPLFVSYLGLAVGACIGGTSIGRWFIPRPIADKFVRTQRSSHQLAAFLLFSTGCMYYAGSTYDMANTNSLWWLVLLGIMGIQWVAGLGVMESSLATRLSNTVFLSGLIVIMAVGYITLRLLDVDESDRVWLRVAAGCSFAIYVVWIGGMSVWQSCQGDNGIMLVKTDDMRDEKVAVQAATG